MERIGIFGGTFNPIHIAHLIIAERFVEQLNLDRCLFVPNYISPFKIEENIQNHPSPDQRLEMVKLSLQNNPRFELDTFELDRKTVSYTIDTVKHFSQKYASAKLFLLIGTDQARYFKKWKDWQEILEYCRLCIAVRPESNFDKNYDKLDPSYMAGIESIYIDCPKLDISASEIRYRIKNNLSVKYLVHSRTRIYLESNGFYK